MPRIAVPRLLAAVHWELIVLAISCAVVYGAALRFQPVDALNHWMRNYDRWELEELSSLLIVLAAGCAILARRRWVELRREIGRRELTEQQLRSSEERFSTAFLASPYPMAIMSWRSGQLLEVNEDFLRSSGYSRGELLDRTPGEVGLWGTSDLAPKLLESLKDRGSARNIEVGFFTKDGARRIALLSVALIELAGERCVVAAINDITERKSLEEQLAHQALHDLVTGLPNRALLQDRVAHALERGQRAGNRNAVLFLDLDNFKNTNDSLGHAAGDELLKQVASRIHGCLRGSDTCARLGGDEFAVLLEDLPEEALASFIAERLMTAVRAPFNILGNDIFVGASVGIAFSESGQGAEELLRNADLAMYMAKRAGKGRHETYSPAMYADAKRRLELESDLRRALDRGEFVLRFQPIVKLAAATVVGVEALVRWNHPTRGCLPPMEFIPIAEETGLIVSIGRWILMEACRQGQAWRAAFPRASALSITVNVSGRQLMEKEFPRHVEEALGRSGLPASALVLEIVETVLVQHDQPIVDRLWELKQLGVQLAIDDFGVGYSSLSYLQRLPIDVLKIDKTFIDAVGSIDEPQLARAIIDMGSTLQLRTVAEGIERGEQRERLRDLGCELGQGFYFARPLLVEDVESMLRVGDAEPPVPVAKARASA